MIRPFRAQPVGQREGAVEMTHVKRADRGELMHDHLGPGPGHGVRDLVGIKGIRHHGLGAKLGEHRPL